MRKKASDLLFCLYKIDGTGQTRFLFDTLVQQDVAHELREKLVENIKDQFDRMDGKPTKKQTEVCRREVQHEQKERQLKQVDVLQRRLAEAKALNTQLEERTGSSQKQDHQPKTSGKDTHPFVWIHFLLSIRMAKNSRLS